MFLGSGWLIVGVWLDLDSRCSGDGVDGRLEACMHACMTQDCHGWTDSSQVKVDIGVIDLLHYHNQWHLTSLLRS